jgi:gamma-glutamylputrescine oxidase
MQINQSTYWYFDHEKIFPPLTNDIESDIVVIGGGMAGLSAAHAFAAAGKNVILIEKSICGGGASGKSSGFITPDSELNLTAYVDKYGPDAGQKLWHFATIAVEKIESNIKEFGISCDYQKQATLVVANDASGLNELKRDHENRIKLGYESNLYDAQSIRSLVASKEYVGGIEYNRTFGINPFAYCQGMKHTLKKKGVQIFEDTPALSYGKHYIKTPQGSIKTKHIIVCVDYNLNKKDSLYSDIYHAQTLVIVSERITKDAVKGIFPKDWYLVWDTDLIYNYYRIIDDCRLMIGGGTLLCTYDLDYHYNNRRVVNKLIQYVKRKFPEFRAEFVYGWPGLIGLTKDIVPVAGFNENDKSCYYIMGVAGLPWAAALGYYAAERIVHNNSEFDQYFSPYRKYPLPAFMRYVVGKRGLFALSNLFATRL